MKDIKLKFSDKTEAYSVLKDKVSVSTLGNEEPRLTSTPECSLIEVGTIYEPVVVNPIYGSNAPIVAPKKKDGYFVILRGSEKELEKYTSYATSEDVGVSFSGSAPVPSEVPLWAFREVLIEFSLLNTLLDAISQIQDTITRARLTNFLEYGNYIVRSSPTVNSLGAALGKSPEEIDELFRIASGKQL